MSGRGRPRWSAERRASRVTGRKAPRKRLACRVHRVEDARERAYGHAQRVPRTHPNVSRRSAAVSSKLMHSLDNSDRFAAIPASFPVRNGYGHGGDNGRANGQLHNADDADPLARLGLTRPPSPVSVSTSAQDRRKRKPHCCRSGPKGGIVPVLLLVVAAS